jgi:hypothetical protein
MHLLYNNNNNNKAYSIPDKNENAGRIKFVTDDKIENGTEAFNNYGPKGNEELLMVPLSIIGFLAINN